MHKLTEVNAEERTAMCCVCGPTTVKMKKRGAQCMTVVRAANIRYRQTEGGKAAHKRGNKKYYRRWHGVEPDSLGTSCAICGTLEDLVVDHDHGHCPGNKGCPECVRGRLCAGCNSGLGFFKDDPVRLQAASQYLMRTL